ncbi:MAG: GIY-YIG nuclease family protein [Gordonia sp. (in: high G+C Gram-positive bacteria)]|uniref:GIY-YIG nuclease family protein n=1 Tax=Gordonia sp. (in: high G+C Gram-positive bacteria) TaxID=84139 RepID=UPI003C7470D9
MSDEQLDEVFNAAIDAALIVARLFECGWRVTSRTETTDSVPHITVTAAPPDDADWEAGDKVAAATGIPFGPCRLTWTGPPSDRWHESWQLDAVSVSGKPVDLESNPDIAGAVEWAALCSAPAWTLSDGVDAPVRRHSDGKTMPESKVSITPETHVDDEDEIASRKRSVESWADEHGFEASIRPADPNVVEAALGERGEGTAGYYLLQFENGDCYVGQSKAIHQRLVAHRADRKGIEAIRLLVDAAAGRMTESLPHLLRHEKKLIHSAQRANLPTLNKAEMTYRVDPRPVDEVLADSGVTTAQWLADPIGVNEMVRTEVCVYRPSLGEVTSGRDALELLRKRAGGSAEMIHRIQSCYVRRCLPLPAATELTHWVVSSPKVTPTFGTLTNLSVGWTEALRINRNGSGWVMVNGVELLGEDAGDEAVVRFLRQHPGAILDDAPYRDTGAFNLNVRAPNLEVLADLLDDTAVTRAAATAAMHLMRARKVGKNRDSHNAVLASSIMGVPRAAVGS